VDTSRERDQSVERLLRQSLKSPRQADATELCLDAETLAAWVDSGLSGAALDMAQSHVADCERCQSLIGAMARANSVIPASEPERTRRPWLAWLVPLTAVAAALTLWVAVPREKYVSVAPAPPAADAHPLAAPPEATAPPAQTRSSAAITAERQAAPAPEVRRDAARLEIDALKEEPKDEAKLAPPAAPAAAAPAAVGAIAGGPPQAARAAAAAEAVADKAQSANGVSQAAPT
jgi:hypothetical protein